jgi:predicted kinase
MTIELVLLVGLQGSGKSSFYRTYFAESHALVSKAGFRTTGTQPVGSGNLSRKLSEPAALSWWTTRTPRCKIVPT